MLFAWLIFKLWPVVQISVTAWKISIIFLELGQYEKNVNNKIHKYYAYRKAAHSIMECPTKLTSGQEAMENLVN